MRQTVSRPPSELLQNIYAFVGPVYMRLIRAYTNDVYFVATPGERFVLKCYGVGWRLDAEIRYEVDLVKHLCSRGVHAARAIEGKNGEALQYIEMDGRQRQCVLFEYAAGEKPEPPFSPEMYYREGQAVAELHQAADDFVAAHDRRALGLEYLIDRPLALVQTLQVDGSVQRYLVDFGRQLRAKIEEFRRKGLDWGVCHGDVTFDNLHLTSDGLIVWYDFDSGGFGWRAIDLQGWVATDPEMLERQDAFVEGYRAIRDMSQNDVDASPYLFAAQEIWGLEVDLRRRIMPQGNEAVRSYLTDAAGRLRPWAALFGFHSG